MSLRLLHEGELCVDVPLVRQECGAPLRERECAGDSLERCDSRAILLSSLLQGAARVQRPPQARAQLPGEGRHRATPESREAEPVE